MSDFDDKLHHLLSAEDDAFITENLEQTGYHQEVLASFRGKGRGLRIGVWIGIMVACMILFFSGWKFFQADTTRDQIMFAALAVMANSGQIALKHWFNQRLNRRAIMIEIKRLRLEIAHAER